MSPGLPRQVLPTVRTAGTSLTSYLEGASLDHFLGWDGMLAPKAVGGLRANLSRHLHVLSAHPSLYDNKSQWRSDDHASNVPPGYRERIRLIPGVPSSLRLGVSRRHAQGTKRNKRL